MHSDWETNVFAGLEELDADGHDLIAIFGQHDPSPDEPSLVANTMPVFDELDLDGHSPRLA
jgi:hypothetical protein